MDAYERIVASRYSGLWVKVGKVAMLDLIIPRVHDPEFRAELEEIRAKEVAELPKKLPQPEIIEIRKVS